MGKTRRALGRRSSVSASSPRPRRCARLGDELLGLKLPRTSTSGWRRGLAPRRRDLTAAYQLLLIRTALRPELQRLADAAKQSARAGLPGQCPGSRSVRARCRVRAPARLPLGLSSSTACCRPRDRERDQHNPLVHTPFALACGDAAWRCPRPGAVARRRQCPRCPPAVPCWRPGLRASAVRAAALPALLLPALQCRAVLRRSAAVETSAPRRRSADEVHRDPPAQANLPAAAPPWGSARIHSRAAGPRRGGRSVCVVIDSGGGARRVVHCARAPPRTARRRTRSAAAAAASAAAAAAAAAAGCSAAAAAARELEAAAEPRRGWRRPLVVASASAQLATRERAAPRVSGVAASSAS